MPISSNIPAARADVYGLASSAPELAANASEPPLPRRAQMLGWYWQQYRATQYESRARDWNGNPALDPIAHEAMARDGSTPFGFSDPYGQLLPLNMRRPTAPQHLVRQTVTRFTHLLFADGRHPKLTAGDPATTDWLEGAVEAGRLWARMSLARNIGGGMGVACVGFTFSRGRPVFEVHDPRWCKPTFETPFTRDVAALEIRYAFSTQEYDPEAEESVTRWWWYRRVIDEKRDTVWPKAPVDPDGREPRWDVIDAKVVEHGYGVCPVVWMQNVENLEDIDGDPDCWGAFETAAEVDRLIAQANKGIVANCDPTLVVNTDDEESDDVAKGSDNALYVSQGGGANYLEITGSGPKAAYEAAERLEQRFCRMVGVVLDQMAVGGKTATEVRQDYSAMWERVGGFREQYGELGVKRLLERLVIAARAVQSRVRMVGTKVVRTMVQLPPKKIVDPATGETTLRRRVLPDASIAGQFVMIELEWPPLTTPTVGEAMNAVSAARSAVEGGFCNEEHAARFVAPFLKIEDPAGMMREIREAAAKYQQEQDAMMMDTMGQGGDAAPEITEVPDEEAPATDEAVDPVMGVKFFAYEIEDGVVTINEVRRSKGLGVLTLGDGVTPDPDGNLTLPRYKAKHLELFQTAAAATDGSKTATDHSEAAQE